VDPRLLALYFVIGGLTVAAVTYFGVQGKSEFAVFIAFLPSTTLLTLVTIYLGGGTGAAVSYAKSMLILLPAWVIYVVGVIFLLPRLGIALSLVVSVAAYIGAAFFTMKLT
jgi:uncharacterized membrane protein YecN with MAPEG domain